MAYVGIALAALTILLFGFWALSEIIFACKICLLARDTSQFWKWAWGDAATYIGGIPMVLLLGIPIYFALMILLPLLPGRKPIHQALSESLVPLTSIERFLSQDRNLVELTDHNGHTPLHIAANKRNDQAVELLLRYGADPTAKDRDGATPLDIANDAKDRFRDDVAARKIELLRDGGGIDFV